MHIGLLDATTRTDHPDADEHGVAALARMARREGHRVSLLSWPAGGLELPGPSQAAMATADVVHAVAAADHLPTLARQMQAAPPWVLTITDLPPTDDDPPARVLACGVPKSTPCVVRSAYAARRWGEVAPWLDTRLLPQGIDLLALMNSAAARPSAPQEAGGRDATLVCVGPFGERSGIDILLRAFAAVGRPGLQLHLLGQLNLDTAFGRNCAALSSEVGRVSVVPLPTGCGLTRLQRSADLLCVPSLDPLAFAGRVHEAAAVGLPCLVSDLGAQVEAVRMFRCGTSVRPGDVVAWAAALSDWADGATGRTPALPTAPLPMRIEEEAFLYEGLYRQAMHARQSTGGLGG